MKHSFVRTEINRITNSIESESVERRIIQERLIPEKKTIPEYRCALDVATETFFFYGCDDDFLAILDDAMKHQRCPRDYKSFEVENFTTNGVYVRQGVVSYDTSGKVTIKITFCYGKAKINANNLKLSGGVTITPNIGKLIGACQHTILRIENILRKK